MTEAGPAGESGASAPRQHRIIVLDDDEAVGRFVQATLKAPKYRTEWCSDLEGALASVAKDRPISRSSTSD